MENNEICEYVYTFLGENNLHIIDNRIVNLRDSDIEYIWDFTKRDPLSKNILIKYMTGIPLDLIQIEGKNAISAIVILKKEVRKKFSKSFYENCIHAPKNVSEYRRDWALFTGKRQLNDHKIPLIYDTSRFERYTNLNEKVISSAARELITLTKGHSFDKSVWRKKKKYSLILQDDDIHELVYVAAAIYEYIPGITLCEAYLKCIVVEIYASVQLYESDDFYQINNMMLLLKKAGLNVDVK